MAKLAIKKDSTDVTVYLFIQASNVTTGAGLTGLAYNTANLVASYVRPLAARAALSLATQTVDGAHSDGGFVEVDATNMPGIYRLDLPDAVCASGAVEAVVSIQDAGDNNFIIMPTKIELRADPISVADILTTQMTESYATNGTAPTLAQSQFAIHQMLMQFAISGTSYTVKKLDNSTTAFVVTLDDATTPTSAVRT